MHTTHKNHITGIFVCGCKIIVISCFIQCDNVHLFDSRMCDPSLTCMEPESKGQIVEGNEFHKFYFDNGELLVRLPTSDGEFYRTTEF